MVRTVGGNVLNNCGLDRSVCPVLPVVTADQLNGVVGYQNLLTTRLGPEQNIPVLPVSAEIEALGWGRCGEGVLLTG